MTGLVVDDVRLGFGGVTALDELSFAMPRGAISALIGPNGAGKTSLFNCVSGHYVPQRGSLRFGDVDLLGLRPHQVVRAGVARTFQNLALFPNLTVLENVQCGRYSAERPGLIASTVGTFSARRHERDSRRFAYAILERFGLTDLARSRPEGLAFGTLKRIEIARAVAAEPTLLMLDEPANGLDGAEVDEMADLVRDLRDEGDMSVVLVEHHMGMVSKICDYVVVMDQGRQIAAGTPADVANDPTVVAAYLGGTR